MNICIEFNNETNYIYFESLKNSEVKEKCDMFNYSCFNICSSSLI